MIEEQTRTAVIQRTAIIKQQNLARLNNKPSNWLRLLSLHQQNQDHQACDSIIRDEIHERFIMREGFWENQIRNRFEAKDLGPATFEFAMLAMEDGLYGQVAQLISNKLLQQLKAGHLRQTFCLSILQKLLGVFGFDVRVATFFETMRNVLLNQKGGNSERKIRACFHRQLKLAHQDFDVVWDKYQHWQPDPSKLSANHNLYSEAKSLWEQRMVEFDENSCSMADVRLSLFNLQSTNQRKIDEGSYMHWVELLPTETDKLWYLRRMALNYQQCLMPYLFKLELYYLQDQQTLIKQYKGILRIADGNREVELKYLHYLSRRIGRHLLKQQLPAEYNQQWSGKVVFFREEVSELIQKERPEADEEEKRSIFLEYYRLWIEVEEKVIKDKDSVCQLYQNLLKGAQQLQLYEDYASSLVSLSALRQGRNVLKRYIHHAKNVRSRDVYLNFIQMYGTVEDQVEFFNGATIHPKQVVMERMMDQKKDVKGGKTIQQKGNDIQAGLKDEEVKEKKGFKREREKDELEEKIEDGTRKKLHVDGEATVYVRGIPTNWGQGEVLNALVNKDKVARVTLVVKNHQQKDYCYVEFQDKETAQQEVSLNKSDGLQLHISKPPSDYDQKSTIFLCALPQTATVENIKALFPKHLDSINDVRLKLSKQKNYAYVQFDSEEQKQIAFIEAKKTQLTLDGKKILVQHCDSSRAKTKKFIPVVFIKNLAFKAKQKDLRLFFQGKIISKLSIPLNADKRAQGFAYVQFERFRDYQDALDMKRGTILGREFQILRSDREITQPHGHQREDEPQEKRASKSHKKESSGKGGQVKDNGYFSNLFK